MVQCKWWDSKKLKYRIKSMHVEISSDMDAAAKLGAVNSAAFELRDFFGNHHNQANDMPDFKRGRGSDDEYSAETAPCDPVRKASKTACAETDKETD